MIKSLLTVGSIQETVDKNALSSCKFEAADQPEPSTQVVQRNAIHTVKSAKVC